MINKKVKKPTAKEFIELKNSYKEAQGNSVQRGFALLASEEKVKELTLVVAPLKEDNEALHTQHVSDVKTIDYFHNRSVQGDATIESLKKVIAHYELLVITIIALVAIHVALVAVHSV